MQANDDYILLLSKQFSGDISPAESNVLDQWLAQSPENEQLAAELRQVWEKTGDYTKAFSPNLDVAFRQVQQRINIAEKPRSRVVPLGPRLLRIAAALALLLFAVWGYREIASPPMLTATASAEDKRLISLPDGSRVWLRRDAALEYPAAFSGSERRVKLVGEAFFEVKHDPAQPFHVDLAEGGSVDVLGTQFSVRQNDTEKSVLVKSGKVRFNMDGNRGEVTLEKGEKAVYNRPANTLQKMKVTTFNELSWQTGGLEFVKTPMHQVITDLEQFYNVKITLRNPAMRSCAHISPLTNQPIEKVLESLALTYDFRVTTPAPGQYELSGGNCQ